MVDNILFALKAFEKRNNISAAIEICSDGSGNILEFWDDGHLERFNTPEELFSILETINYKKDERGICISPVERI